MACSVFCFESCINNDINLVEVYIYCGVSKTDNLNYYYLYVVVGG